MLSAHGSAPEVVEAARDDGRVVVDAVCPLVTKVHHELKVRARKGYTVLYVGHHGHEEAVGTMAVAPESVRLLERVEDVDALDLVPVAAGDDAPMVALLAQTTLSHDEWAGIVDRARERFPDLWMPNRSDLCFATTNRQAALKALAGRCDAVVVIGSENSSNTVALAKVAVAFGCPRVVRVNDAVRAARRPLGDGRGHRRCLGSRGPGRRRRRPAGPRGRRRERLGDRRGGVLPAATRAPRAAPWVGVARLAARRRPGGAHRGPTGERPERVLSDDRTTAAADVLEQIAALTVGPPAARTARELAA